MAVVPAILNGLTGGSRRALAKSITLIESKRAQDRDAAVSLIESALPHAGKSLRVGISGVPWRRQVDLHRVLWLTAD